jgi:hypothetical protein
MNNLVNQRPLEFVPPCEIQGMSFEDYTKTPAINVSFLKDVIKHSPFYAKNVPRKEKKAFDTGTLAHLMILEPERAKEDIIVEPHITQWMRTNASKREFLDWLEETFPQVEPPSAPESPEKAWLDGMIKGYRAAIKAAGIMLVGQQEYDKARKMRDSVIEHPIGRAVFAGGEPEITMLARDSTSELLMKARVDWVPDGHDLLIDLKSTRCVSREEFARDAGKYQYHMQAAGYTIIDQLVHDRRTRREFLFVVLTNEEPYEAAFYKLDWEALQKGEARFNKALDMYSWCLKNNHWPGSSWDWNNGSDTIHELTIPRWAL